MYLEERLRISQGQEAGNITLSDGDGAQCLLLLQMSHFGPLGDDASFSKTKAPGQPYLLPTRVHHIVFHSPIHSKYFFVPHKTFSLRKYGNTS